MNVNHLDRAEALLVLGMHRSGTSAVTRVLNVFGAELGAALLPPADDNDAGFWENSEVVRINELLLEYLGMKWHDAVALPSDWQEVAHEHGIVNAIREFIRTEFRGASLFALKDPRLCRFAPLWIKVLREEGISPKILVALRHPEEVARSLAKRDRFSHAKSAALWLIHAVESLSISAGLPYVLVSYDRLLSNWRGEVRKIASELQLSWPVNFDVAEPIIDAFINPALRHHDVKADLQSASKSAALPKKVLALFDVFNKAIDAGRPQAYELHAYIQEAEAWLDAFGGSGSELLKHNRALERDFQLAGDRIRQFTMEINAARENIDQLVGQIDLARVANDDLEGQVRRAREQSALRDQTELLLREALTKSEDESAIRLNVLSQHEAELEKARARIRSLEEQLKGALERNDESANLQSPSLESSLIESSARIGALESDLAAALHRVNELTAKLERSSAEAVSLERQLAERMESMQSHINNLDSALNYERDQNSDLLARLACLQGENLALRSQLEQARKQ